MTYANNKGPDQPVHPRSLISTFVVRCLDIIIPLVSLSELSSLYPVPVAAQASLSLTWLQTPKTGFLMTSLKLLWIMCFFWDGCEKWRRNYSKQYRPWTYGSFNTAPMLRALEWFHLTFSRQYTAAAARKRKGSYWSSPYAPKILLFLAHQILGNP